MHEGPSLTSDETLPENLKNTDKQRSIIAFIVFFAVLITISAMTVGLMSLLLQDHSRTNAAEETGTETLINEGRREALKDRVENFRISLSYKNRFSETPEALK